VIKIDKDAATASIPMREKTAAEATKPVEASTKSNDAAAVEALETAEGESRFVQVKIG
jgi:hypothetical protein